MTRSLHPDFISETDAAEAFENLKRNDQGTWPGREDGNRVEPFCLPHFQAPFPLVPGSSVFTIGSCFARNVERSLMRLGFDVPARRTLGTQIAGNVLNTFTAASMLNEVRWALDPDTPFDPDTHFYDAGAGKVVDLHLGVRWALPVDRKTALERRATITRAYRELPRSHMLILTLGLTEAWYDSELDLYLNMSPLKSMIKREPGRFRLRVLRQSQVVRQISQLIALAREYNEKGRLNCVLTVSPVPMTSTFRPDTDVIVANAGSKATLRSAAEEVAQINDDVAYFPSYESITTSDRSETWEDDHIHVRQKLTDMNVARMIAKYVTSETSGVTDPDILTQRALTAIERGSFEEGVGLADQVLQMAPGSERAVFARMLGLSRLDRPSDAIATLVAPDADTGQMHDDVREKSLDIRLLCARLLLKEQQLDDAFLVAKACTADHPAHSPAHVLLGDIHLQMGDFAGAEQAYRACLALSKRMGLPYFKLARLEHKRGNTEQAVQLIDVAIKFSPGHAGMKEFKSRLTG